MVARDLWVGEPFHKAQTVLSHVILSPNALELGWCMQGPLAQNSLTYLPCPPCTVSLRALTIWSSDESVLCGDSQMLFCTYMSISEATSCHVELFQGYSVRQGHIYFASFSPRAKVIAPSLTIWQLHLKFWLHCKSMARFPLDTDRICCHCRLKNR